MRHDCSSCTKWHTVCGSDAVGICERLVSKQYLLKIVNRSLKTSEVLDTVEDMLTGCDGMCMYWKGLES